MDGLDTIALEHRYAEVNGVRLHYVESGSGPLVVLLHGFPDYWYTWHNQIPALVKAGFRVVAPDMRGYNLSDKPAGVDAYRGEALAADIAALIHHCEETSAVLVGHDWGAAVAWMVATWQPTVVRKLVILNVPHPAKMLKGLRTLRQMRKSWYMFFFLLPKIPEAVIRRRNFHWFRGILRHDPVRPNAFLPADVAQYVEAWSQPGAITASINYYRAALRQNPRKSMRKLVPITVPTLVIWGELDRYLGAELAQPDPKFVPNCRIERLPHASHWVQHDEPERINQLLTEFARF